MAKTGFAGGLFVILLLIIVPAGCKDTKKQKALAEETAQAKAEVVKLKAETVQLKSEISYLNEKLAAANLARDKAQIQMDKLLEDQNAVSTDAEDLQKENDKLRKILAEQLKKGNERDRQIENLTAVIRKLQARMEPNKISEPALQPPEEIPAANSIPLSGR